MKKLLIIITVLLLGTDAWTRPLIVAHRGGKENWPENTIYAIKKAQELGVDIIELDLQLTKDGIPVVYHPKDLSEWTQGKGSVRSHTAQQIKKLNAGWNYKTGNEYPFRKENLTVPTLREVLKEVTGIPLILDLKSLPAEPLVRALIQEVPDDEWKRIIVYSTNKEHIEVLKQLRPTSITFEERKTTRQRLLHFINSHECSFPSDAQWLGFELKRKMTVLEKFTLGEDQDDVEFELWSPESMRCSRKMAPKAKVILFGINSKEAWREAMRLKADAVYTDSPKLLLQER